MKILHTSDWHLGMSLKLGTMIEDQRYFLEQLYNIIKEEDVDAIICAGDIYDTSVTNAEAIELYNEAVTKICAQIGKKMIVIAGNHDSGARLASCRELLKSSGLFVSGKLTRDIEPISLDNADIYSIPYFNRDEVICLFPEKKDDIHSQEDATRVVCDHIRESMNKDKINIAVSHAYVVGAELSESDRAAQIGTASVVSKSVFDGFDYVALGHIHKPQVISKTIRYSGSPIKYSFGNEEKQEKQVVIFDTITKEQNVIPLKMLHDRKHIEGTYDEIIASTGYETDYLKIKVTDRIAGLTLLAELRDKFPFLLELYGMSIEATGEESAISVEELERLNEVDIMKRFLAEEYSFTPSEDQIKMFKDAIESVEKGDNLG